MLAFSGTVICFCDPVINVHNRYTILSKPFIPSHEWYVI